MGCATQKPTVTTTPKKAHKANQRAINHFVDGITYDLNQNYAAALLSYQEALLYDSSAAAIYLNMARDYIRLGKQESAILTLKRCIRWNPDHIETRELLAQIYIAQRKWPHAEKMYHEILGIDNGSHDAYFSLALLYLQLNKKEQAAEMYKGLLALQPIPDPQILLDLGELQIEMYKYQDADSTFKKLIEVAPEEGLSYYGAGLAREALKDTVQAVAHYKRALELNRGLVEARDRLSRIYMARQAWEKAIGIFSEAVRQDSADLTGWLAMSENYRLSGDSAEALITYNKIKNLFPDDWRAYLEAGRIYMERQDFKNSYTEFKAVIERADDLFWGWLFTGISLVHLDSLHASQPYLTKALQIVPEDPLGNYYLGTALAQLGEPAEAVPYLETAIKRRDGWISALSALASAHEALKNYQRADELYQEALRLEPENALLLNNYGYSLSERGIRLEDAKQMATKALKQEPQNGAYLDTLGWIYFKLGDYEKAREFIEKASEVRESAEVAKHLGDVYHKLGYLEKAREAWEKALSLDNDNVEILERLGQVNEE